MTGKQERAARPRHALLAPRAVAEKDGNDQAREELKKGIPGAPELAKENHGPPWGTYPTCPSELAVEEQRARSCAAIQLGSELSAFRVRPLLWPTLLRMVPMHN